MNQPGFIRSTSKVIFKLKLINAVSGIDIFLMAFQYLTVLETLTNGLFLYFCWVSARRFQTLCWLSIAVWLSAAALYFGYLFLILTLPFEYVVGSCVKDALLFSIWTFSLVALIHQISNAIFKSFQNARVSQRRRIDLIWRRDLRYLRQSQHRCCRSFDSWRLRCVLIISAHVFLSLGFGAVIIAFLFI